MPLIITPRQFTQRAELFQQLAQLTSAGIPIVRALEQIKRSPPARSFRAPLQRLLDELAKGATLAESLQSLDWLPAFDLALIGAGEQSGRLDICFRLLAGLLQRPCPRHQAGDFPAHLPRRTDSPCRHHFFNRAAVRRVAVQCQPGPPDHQSRTRPLTALWRRRLADLRHAKQTR